MAEYIEREEALNLISDIFFATDPNGEEQCGVIKCSKAIRNAPAADVVEVVRCSECKHHHDPMRCSLWYGTLDDNEYFLEHGKDFYCAFGERRSENEG